MKLKKNLFILLLLITAITLSNCDRQEPYQDPFVSFGDTLSISKKDPNSVLIHCSNGRVKLTFQSESILRVHAAPEDKPFAEDNLYLSKNGPYHIVNYDPVVEVDISISDKKEHWSVSGGNLTVHITKTPFRMEFFGPDGQLLLREPEAGGLGFYLTNSSLPEPSGWVRARFDRADDEHFFGLGGDSGGEDCQVHPLDKTDTDTVIKAGEGAFLSPFYYSTRGYGLFFANIGPFVPVSFKDPVELRGSYDGTAGKDLDYYVIYGPSFERILDGYTMLTGKPLLPEKWFFGLLMSNYAWGSPAAIENAVERFDQGDWPLDALIEDYAWRGNRDVAWKYEPDEVGPMLKHLDRMGVKLGLHVNGANFFDVTDPKSIAVNWAKYDAIARQGVDFWWQDQSEGGKVNRFSNSLFGTLWAKVLVEGMAKHHRSVPVISRCASTGGQRYISPWGGDIKMPVNNIRSDLSFIRDVGMIGYPASGCDMGGFGNDRSDLIIFRRVIQPFLVFPIIRPHGKNGSKPPWTISERARNMWRFYCKLRYRLHPYIYSAAIEAHRTGRPILAPLVFDNTDDPRTYTAEFDFLLGRHILVAPVVNWGAVRRVYLPEGNWIHFWTGKTFQGKKKVTILAPRSGRSGLPVFVKEGSILPMIPETNRIDETSGNPLTLDIYPMQSGTSSYRLLDCDTPRGPVSETRYTCQSDPDRIRVQIENSRKDHVLIIHSIQNVNTVRADKDDLPALPDMESFAKAEQGWFVGSGLFPGSPEIRTINIKFRSNTLSSHSVEVRF